MLDIEKIKQVNQILNKEFDNNMKEDLGKWEFHQLTLLIGLSKDLLKALNDPKELERANKIYKQVKKEQCLQK